MKTKVILIGGFHETIELIEKSGVDLMGIVDQSKPTGLKYPYLGTDHEFVERGKYKDLKIIIAPDLPEIRSKLADYYITNGYTLTTLAVGYISPSAKIGNGVVVQDQAYISSNVSLCDGVKVNVGAKVMHDSFIDRYTTIAPCAVVLGGVNIGKECYLGANATILPGVRIGDGVTIGAGAVVTKDVSAGAIVKGVPAK